MYIDTHTKPRALVLSRITYLSIILSCITKILYNRYTWAHTLNAIVVRIGNLNTCTSRNIKPI